MLRLDDARIYRVGKTGTTFAFLVLKDLFTLTLGAGKDYYCHSAQNYLGYTALISQVTKKYMNAKKALIPEIGHIQ